MRNCFGNSSVIANILAYQHGRRHATDKYWPRLYLTSKET